MDDVGNRELADALELAVVSLDSGWPPNIPGLPHPTTARPRHCGWPSAEQLFGATKLSTGVFSAGATLAMTTLLRLNDRGHRADGCAVLQSGTYDLSA